MEDINANMVKLVKFSHNVIKGSTSSMRILVDKFERPQQGSTQFIDLEDKNN